MRKIFSNAKLVLMLSICALMIALISIIVIAPSMIIEAQANALNVSSVEKYYFTPQTISSRSNSQERIEYTSYKVALDNEILTPLYYNLDSSLINICGAVAGANLIGYYDIEYTNLIPNFDSAIIRSGKKIFKSVSTSTQNVINDLYLKMNTNATGVGVTYSQFINGLTSYVNAAGYSATIDECVSNGQISVNTIKNNIENGIPMVCFCTMSYYINNISIGSSETTLTKVDYQANHIMVVNGIKQVAYFQNGENFRTDTYLKVASGLQENVSAYILLSSIVLDNMKTVAIN